MAAGDGLRCFTGDPAALAPFAVVRNGRWFVLDRRGELTEAQVAFGQSGYADGWMEAVFETAVATMTPYFQSRLVDAEDRVWHRDTVVPAERW